MWQNFAKGLVNIQIGCQKGPLESGECDENSGNLLAMVKTESGKRNSPEGLQKLKWPLRGAILAKMANLANNRQSLNNIFQRQVKEAH